MEEAPSDDHPDGCLRYSMQMHRHAVHDMLSMEPNFASNLHSNISILTSLYMLMLAIRRLIFLQNQHFIQSEVRLLPAAPRAVGESKENIVGLRMDLSHVDNIHLAVLASLSLAPHVLSRVVQLGEQVAIYFGTSVLSQDNVS